MVPILVDKHEDFERLSNAGARFDPDRVRVMTNLPDGWHQAQIPRHAARILRDKSGSFRGIILTDEGFWPLLIHLE